MSFDLMDVTQFQGGLQDIQDFSLLSSTYNYSQLPDFTFILQGGKFLGTSRDLDMSMLQCYLFSTK